MLLRVRLIPDPQSHRMHKPHRNRVQQFGDNTLVRDAPAHPMFFLQRKSGRAFEIRSYNFVQKGEHAARNSLHFTSGNSHGELLRAWDAPYSPPFCCVGNLDRVMRLRPASVHQTRAISSAILMCSFLKFDGLAKSPPSRHPGESRSPEVLGIPGFRLPPE